MGKMLPSQLHRNNLQTNKMIKSKLTTQNNILNANSRAR